MSSHCAVVEDPSVLERENKILLMGCPNVGKSVFFSELTGVYVVSSNYTGTTVSFMEGKMQLGDKSYHLIDLPGTYTMNASSEAEAVAVRFMESGPKAVLFVLDATNLEGGLRLALELKRYNVPIVYALNMIDVAQRKGLDIDVSLLAQKLGGQVIPTVAVKREGFDAIRAALQRVAEAPLAATGEAATALACSACSAGCSFCPQAGAISCQANELYWQQARQIAQEVVKSTSSTPSRLDRLGDVMMRPWPGIPIALVVVLASLGVVVGAGKALRAVLLLPLVNNVIVPFVRGLFTKFIPPGILLNILVGEYGFFVISFEWILALIMPYVLIFYVVFTFLEDTGYMPRLAVLFDNVVRKVGVQGGSLINIMLAFGCAVPAIIGTRAATTRKERLMVTTMICFAVPCISQTGALLSLTGSYSVWMMLGTMGVALVVFVLVGMITSRLYKGTIDPLIIEVPNLLAPDRQAYWVKLKVRVKDFLLEAEGPMLLAVAIAAIFKESGMLDAVASFLEPVMVGWLGMPREAVMGLVLGIVRREMAVAPLLALNLTPLQMFTGAVVALLYLPCLSVFGILAKEFDTRVALGITAATTLTSLLVGGLIHKIGTLLLGVV